MIYIFWFKDMFETSVNFRIEAQSSLEAIDIFENYCINNDQSFLSSCYCADMWNGFHDDFFEDEYPKDDESFEKAIRNIFPEKEWADIYLENLSRLPRGIITENPDLNIFVPLPYGMRKFLWDNFYCKEDERQFGYMALSDFQEIKRP